MPSTSPPTAGPMTPPSRKPPWKAAAARPRWSGAATRSRSASADTVNIAEPRPPMPRSTSSCVYDVDSPANADDTATMLRPVARVIRSPTRSTSHPAGSAPSRRMNANTLTTALAQNAVTPNSSAKIGMAGPTMPNPRATQKATDESTPTSRGRPLNQPNRPRPRSFSGAGGTGGGATRIARDRRRRADRWRRPCSRGSCPIRHVVHPLTARSVLPPRGRRTPTPQAERRRPWRRLR